MRVVVEAVLVVMGVAYAVALLFLWDWVKGER